MFFLLEEQKKAFWFWLRVKAIAFLPVFARARKSKVFILKIPLETDAFLKNCAASVFIAEKGLGFFAPQGQTEK